MSLLFLIFSYSSTDHLWPQEHDADWESRDYAVVSVVRRPCARHVVSEGRQPRQLHDGWQCQLMYRAHGTVILTCGEDLYVVYFTEALFLCCRKGGESRCPIQVVGSYNWSWEISFLRTCRTTRAEAQTSPDFTKETEQLRSTVSLGRAIVAAWPWCSLTLYCLTSWVKLIRCCAHCQWVHSLKDFLHAAEGICWNGHLLMLNWLNAGSGKSIQWVLMSSTTEYGGMWFGWYISFVVW